MTRFTAPFAILAVLALPGKAAFAQSGCSAISIGPGASLNGFVPFTSASLWNTNIAGLPVDPNSQAIINFIGTSVTLHPDFGSGEYAGQTIGIPYQVEAATQPLAPIHLGAYASESDPGPAQVPPNALIEGYPHPGSGDRHVLVLEQGGCWLYELYNAKKNSDGSWSANSAALWDLLGDEQRPYTWTSADAAGLPVFPGLVRYDEASAGRIAHALRFTVPTTQEAFVLPATHWASSNSDPSAPPMGTRLRLKASFDVSGFSPINQTILTAFQQYGLILADNGSAIYVTGSPDNRWNNNDLAALESLTASDFEVVQQGTIYTPANVPTGASPVISSFTANPLTIAAGQTTTLSWTVSNSAYNIITPSVGATRTTSAIVSPAVTTTYRLDTTNQYGRTSKVVTVTAQ